MRRATRTSRLACLLTPLLLSLGACGTASDSSVCEDTCWRIRECTGGATAGTPAALGWACPRSAGCGTQDSCQAQCIMAAPCAAVSGADTPGAEDLQSCMAACAGPGPKTDDPKPGSGPETSPNTEPPPETDPPPDPPPCTPQCGGKECGDDGCGGQCGSCESYLACDPSRFSCMPKTPPSCYDVNECLYEGQKLCTATNKYRSCVKGFDGCLTWDCST